nr:GAF domain-containing protein [Bacteroidota bacterium]
MKKWFLNLKIKSRLNTMTTISILSIILIGYASFYFFRTTKVLTLVLTEQRVHDVNYRTGLQLFYEYLNNQDDHILKRAYMHLDSAANIAFVFSKSKEYYIQHTHDRYVDVLLDTYGPTINYERSVAELIANRFELMMFLDNPQMNDALEIADEAYRNGKKVKAAIKAFLENPNAQELSEKLEQAKTEMSGMEVRFSGTVAKLNNFVINLLLISILLIAVVLVIITFFSSRLISATISKPILRVVDNLKNLATGNLNTDIQVETTDEIGKLNASFIDLQSSLKQKSDVAGAIANGDFSYSADPKSDQDELAFSINQIVQNFGEVVDQANRIAQGDLDTNITMRSDHDVLGRALISMTTELKSSNEGKQQQLWLKNSQSDLNDVMRGEQEIFDLSQKIIGKICQLVDARVGAIYLEDEEDVYKLVGSYAFKVRKTVKNEYHKGEGLVGQAVLEKQPIIITKVPDDYISINSGLGEAAPKNIIVVPCMFNDQVIGVVEIGSFNEFNHEQINFIHTISESIAIGLNASKGRTELRKLLAKTQEQAEELQVQQEELRQANEELEEQTRALKESEQQLQTQQEELRVTNEELEERTRAIEKQRDDIRKKNEALQLAQKEIEKKASDLEMASRYKSEFLANMSHELRTPLNSILVLSQILSNNKVGNLNDKQIQSAKTIHSSGTSLLSLINEILDLSKIESGKLEINIERIKLTDFVRDIDDIFKPLAVEKGLELNIEIADIAPVYMHSDSLRLQQILRNLLSNAIKFTHDGSVTLDIRNARREDVVKNLGIEVNNLLVFEVTDTGIGIPKEQQKAIFEAFTQADGTTSRKYGGTGLGLSISRNLAHILGGDIMMSSDADKGTSFKLFLPIAPDKNQIEKFSPHISTILPSPPEKNQAITNMEAAPEKGIVSERKQPKNKVVPEISENVRDDRKIISKGDKFILIIEDDSAFSQILYDLAHEKGFKCLIAPNGETGLHYADYYKPDAIILDIGLPGIDGWQVMDRLKENPETRHIPVHFMSGKDKS